jgi:RHS repeat-associated protein
VHLYASIASRSTGKERDAESGLDYFGARYYGSSMGRWMSPDSADIPMPVPYANLNNPQSLNLYGYVNNNPLSEVDDDGHDGALPTATCGGGLGGALCRVIQFLGKLGGPGDGPPPGGGPGDFWPNPYGQQVSKQMGQNANQAMPYIAGGGILAAGAAVGPVVALETGPMIGGLSRQALQRIVSQVQNSDLKELVSRLYQEQDKIPGGTAGAIENGIEEGRFISQGGHVIKAAGRLRSLNTLIRSGALHGRDLAIAKWIASSLRDATNNYKPR